MKHFFTLCFLLAATTTFAQQKITPEEASKHIGDSLQVCGKVYDGVYLEKSNGQPTLLNVGGTYPNNPFTIVIFKPVRDSLGADPVASLKGYEACVVGKIELYKGKPQIVLKKKENLFTEK